MTVSVIFLKSFFCLCILTIVVAAVWYYEGNPIKWFAIGDMLTAIVISIVISVRHHWPSFLVPIYALQKECF